MAYQFQRPPQMFILKIIFSRLLLIIKLYHSLLNGLSFYESERIALYNNLKALWKLDSPEGRN